MQEKGAEREGGEGHGGGGGTGGGGGGGEGDVTIGSWKGARQDLLAMKGWCRGAEELEGVGEKADRSGHCSPAVRTIFPSARPGVSICSRSVSRMFVFFFKY